VARVEGGGVRILDRHVLREFLGYLVLGLIGFVVIFMVVDLFEKIDVFLDHRAPLLLVVRFYLYRTPEIVVQILPVALLLATFMALGQLNKFGELTAMRSAGVSLLRLLRPVFGVAMGAVVLVFALSERVVPLANRERDAIYERQIQGVRHEDVTERADVTYLGEGGRIFYMRLYLVNEQRMHEASVQEFRGGTLRRRIDAAEATWDGSRWVFVSGVVRSFEHGKETARPFARMAIGGLAERPEDFAKETRDPGEMDYNELSHYVERLRASGARVANYLVDLHMKLSYPLINLIVVLIGASLATRLRMQSAALGFGLSVVIAFLYYAVLRAGQAFGHNGALPPYLAAWLADLVFGTVGLVMIASAQRR
jgi:lipopolysaccharide export system permease protein